MKKLITFLMLLSLFGVSSVWANNYVLSDETLMETTYTGTKPYYYTASFSNGLTVTYTRTETNKALTHGNNHTIKYSDDYTYTVAGIPTNERITSITFYGYAKETNNTADIYINGEDTGKDLQNTTPYSEHTISDLSLRGGFTFKTDGSESAMIITITTTVITEDNFTVDISKLMMPVGVNANRDINRTIPCAVLTFGGGDGIKFNATDEFIIRNEGTFNVALRKRSDAAKINSIVLHGDFSKYTKANINENITASSGNIVKTDNNTLTWTAASGGADDVTFTSVEVSGVSATISSFDVKLNGEALDNSKVTPTFAFSPASATASTAASGSYTTTLTSSPGFFNAVTFNAGGTGTTLKGTDFIYGTPNTKYTLTSGTTAGNATLTASFAGNDYFNPVSATTYTLTVSAGKAELTDFSFNKDEATYTGTGSSIYVNSKELTNAGTSADPFTFVYDASRSTLKTKFFLDPSLTTIGAEANTTYFTVTSNNEDVLDVSNVSVSATNNGTRLYFDGIKVLKAGTATLTYKFLGSDTYNAKDVDVAFTVESPITTYSGTYPYTWDFTNSTNWNSSKRQLGYYAYKDQWIINAGQTEARNRIVDLTTELCAGIDKIKGLSFSDIFSYSNDENPSSGSLCLDWSTNWMWLNGKVTVPNVSPDYIVRISAETGKTIKVGDATVAESSTGVYEYTPTTTGDVTFTIAAAGVYSIAVVKTAYTAQYTAITSTDLHEGVLTDGKYLIDEKERKLKGKWEFTGAGSCATGTIIKDVPGIEVKFNKGTTELNVTNVDKGGRYQGLVLMGTYSDTGATITFTPYVNGFLSLQGNFYDGTHLNDNDTHLNDEESVTWSASGHTYYQSMTEINVPLIAGKTYTLSGGSYAWELHGFTFRPAFLDVDETGKPTNTDISTTYKYSDSQTYYAANLNKPANRFPHLITSTAGEGKVKFAGNRDIVNLEGDNDVILIGSGSTIIKGTVLLEGSDEELFTYYYLQSTILNLSATKFNGTAIADQAYVDDSNNADTYTFTFSTNIEKVSDAAYKVYLRTDAGDETDITAKTAVSGTDITVTFADGDLVDGSTYRIRIAAGSIKASHDATVTNAEIVRTFSINKSDELQLTLEYPTSVANVGTSIVIKADKVLKDNDNNYKGRGSLKKDGTDEGIAVTFKISGERLIAKPNETLENNTGYTLIIDANSIIEKDGSNKVLTKSKAFSITTGASAGTQAEVVSTYPVDDPKGNIPLPVAFYNGGRISVTFDQAVELEPYSTVYATPVNGSESQTATTALPGDEAASLKVDSDGKTVYWEFNSDYLKYDLFYEIRIPANTVVSSGGKPNARDITFRFRMPKNPNATAVDPDEFYPHTWDFCKFGDGTKEGTSANTIINNAADKSSGMYKTKNALYKSTSSDGYTTYTTHNQEGYGYDQGNDVYVATSTSTKSTLPEFKGIRISLVDERSNRFEIRDVKSKNLDGTNKYIFRMNGNTHYMTLSNVPKGKLYMVVNSKLLGINSPNAKFVDLPDGVTSESDTKITTTGGSTRKLVVDVEEAGDVIFCVGDFSCEKIGVAVDYKKALSSFENYFTDCQEPEMRYDLTGEFTSTSLTAYYVDGSGFKKGDTSINFTPLTNNVALAGEGTIIKASTEDTNIPIFCADVNTTATDHTTSLVGVLENTYIERTDGDKRNYFFTNIAGKVDPESGLPVEEFTESPLGFYRAVAGTLGAHKSYLQLPLDPTNARSIIYINFDGEGETTGIRNLDNNATVQQEGAYYTLTGIRLNGKPSVKGIYILNGKKVMIK